MNNILITGGAGFIGANFVHYWLKRHPGDKLVVLDALTYAGNRHNLDGVRSHSSLEFIHGDIRDQTLVESLLQGRNIDTIVHFAAESHVDRSITGPGAFIDSNIVGTYTLLNAARKVWEGSGGYQGKRFHHVSTDEVYGTLGADDPAFRETTPYAPNSPYAASKAASDHLVRAWHHTYKLPVTTSNCSNNYGPFQFPEKLIPLCLLNILEGKPLPIYGDGRQVRDWLFVDDHSRGIELILKAGKEGETYNIGGNNEQTNIDTVKQLCAIVDQLFARDKKVAPPSALHEGITRPSAPVGAPTPTASQMIPVDCYHPRLAEADMDLARRFPDCPAFASRRCETLINFVTDRPGHDTRYAIDAAKISAHLGYQPLTTFAEGLTDTVLWYLQNENWWRAVKDGSYRQEETLDRV